MRAGLTLLSIRTPADAPPLRSRPRVRALVSAGYRMAEGFTGLLSGSWAGRTCDSSVPRGSVQLSRYMLLDAYVAYDLARFRFTLAISNLLDKEYQQFMGFPGPGRRVRLEIATTL